MLQSKTAELAESLTALVRKIDPDFLIHAGDITDQGDEMSHEFAASFLKNLGIPVVVTPGNHDMFEPGVKQRFHGDYGFDTDIWSQAFEIAGVRIISLDGSVWHWREGPPTDAIDWIRYKDGKSLGIAPSSVSLEWLERELSAHCELPTVLVTHAPVFTKTISPPAVHHPPDMAIPLKTTNAVSEKILALIDRCGGVDMVVSGHGHYHDLTRRGKTLFCTTVAVAEYPCEVRHVTLEDDEFSVNTVGLGEKFAEMSFVVEWDHRWLRGATEADRTLRTKLRADPS